MTWQFISKYFCKFYKLNLQGRVYYQLSGLVANLMNNIVFEGINGVKKALKNNGLHYWKKKYWFTDLIEVLI